MAERLLSVDVHYVPSSTRVTPLICVSTAPTCCCTNAVKPCEDAQTDPIRASSIAHSAREFLREARSPAHTFVSPFLCGLVPAYERNSLDLGGECERVPVLCISRAPAYHCRIMVPALRRASYQDVLDAPPNMTAEVIDGELHLQPKPAPPHVFAESSLTIGLMEFDKRSGGNGPRG